MVWRWRFLCEEIRGPFDPDAYWFFGWLLASVATDVGIECERKYQWWPR